MDTSYFEVAEADRLILNPFTQEKLSLLGEICGVSPGDELLDLACGKGELLCHWADRYGVRGVGVDVSEPFVSDARSRATELGVADLVDFQVADATDYPLADRGVDIASCLGATWIADGLVGTLELLWQATDDGLLLVGEPYWTEEPPEDAVAALADGDPERFGSLVELQEWADHAGFELIEMVLATRDEWDRYEATQWKTVADWLRDHPDHPDAGAIRAQRDENRRTYLEYGRRYFGWGVFVFRRRPH